MVDVDLDSLDPTRAAGFVDHEREVESSEPGTGVERVEVERSERFQSIHPAEERPDLRRESVLMCVLHCLALVRDLPKKGMEMEEGLEEIGRELDLGT